MISSFKPFPLRLGNPGGYPYLLIFRGQHQIFPRKAEIGGNTGSLQFHSFPGHLHQQLISCLQLIRFFLIAENGMVFLFHGIVAGKLAFDFHKCPLQSGQYLLHLSYMDASQKTVLLRRRQLQCFQTGLSHQSRHQRGRRLTSIWVIISFFIYTISSPKSSRETSFRIHRRLCRRTFPAGGSSERREPDRFPEILRKLPLPAQASGCARFLLPAAGKVRLPGRRGWPEPPSGRSRDGYPSPFHSAWSCARSGSVPVPEILPDGPAIPPAALFPSRKATR